MVQMFLQVQVQFVYIHHPCEIMANKFEQILLFYGPIMSLSGSGKVEACMALHTIHTHMHFKTLRWGLSWYESQAGHKEGTSIYSEVEISPCRDHLLWGFLFTS